MYPKRALAKNRSFNSFKLDEILNDKSFQQIKDSLSALKKKYDINSESILQLTQLNKIEELNIPVSIFNNYSLSALESVTKYLREELSLRYCEIASLLNRDDRTIWTVYSRIKNKIKNG